MMVLLIKMILYSIIIEQKILELKFSKYRKNKGLTKSLNIGIEKAQGKYIARQDADDISYKDRFKEQIFWLENYNYDADAVVEL